MGAFDFVGDTYDAIFNPGKDDQKRALDAMKEAAALYDDVYMPTYDDLALSDEDIAAGRHSSDNRLEVGGEHLLSDLDVRRDTTGQQLVDGGVDHFQDIMDGNGFDAVAEADYARARQNSQQARRANTEAVTRGMELRGAGGSGAEALAALSAGQGQADAEYQAGLQANAQRQYNRDNAAGAVMNAGQQQQSADDAWKWNQDAAGRAREGYNADRQWGGTAANWDRDNQVSDFNADHEFGARGYNRSVNQTRFNNEMSHAGGKAAQLSGVANAHSQIGASEFNWGGATMEAGGNVLGAYAGAPPAPKKPGA